MWMRERAGGPLRPWVRWAMTFVYAVVGVGGALVFIARGVGDGEGFFYWLAAGNAVFWLGLLVTILIVDNRRRRAERTSSKSSQ